MADNPGKNDIDFDELDKAVNSLMGKVGDETLDDDAKTKTLEVTTTLKPDDKVKYDEIGKVAEKIGDETLVTDGEVELVEDLSKLPEKMELPVATAIPPVAASVAPAKPAVPRPNSGRFMDMVHPKADMRPVPNESPAPTIGSSSTAPAVQVAMPITVLPEPVISPEPVPTTSAPEAPLTPFLPDAKVEKRPLGGGEALSVPVMPGSPKHAGAQSLESVDFANTDSLATSVPLVDNQLPPTPEQPTADGLAEQTLAKLEASEVTAPVEPATSEAPSIEKVESGDTEGLKNNGTAEQHSGPIETPGGAIYDVNNYHQPLNHPAKKKSGWGVVIVIVVIIVLSIAVAGGAYLYFVARP